MNRSCDAFKASDRHGERGSARLKFILTMAVVAVVAYIGYQYIPVAFQAYQYTDLMQQSVDKGAALGRTSDWAKDQLVKNGAEYGVPPNANIIITQNEGAMEAHVTFKRPISMFVYTYDYEFDKTVKSSSMWSIK
ncbi:MAG: hypothetical protein JOZ52_02325 [Acidobacteria bacterium]|nr:hypothetical protein [Acidobacteriota bacterium]